jgi:hypothetical protein
MILATYTRNNPKRDKTWAIASIALDMTTARKNQQKILDRAHKIGYDTAEVIIQEFQSADDVPATLFDVKPEKLLYN